MALLALVCVPASTRASTIQPPQLSAPRQDFNWPTRSSASDTQPTGCSGPSSAGAPANTAISRENALPGTTSWELTNPAWHGEIAGYASATSGQAGDTLSFHVSTASPIFTAYVYRMGWYCGAGGRLMAVLPLLPGHMYPTPSPDPATGLVVCNWPEAFSLTIPSSWVSGIYLVKLVTLNNLESYIPFVVRAVTPATYVFIHASNTDEAYNTWGGTSLYLNTAYANAGNSTIDSVTVPLSYYRRAVAVSFDRPLTEMGGGLFFFWEYHMVRWLEEHGYDVSYATDTDLDANPRAFTGAHAILIVGHSEYWSRSMRTTVQEAVDHGTNLAVFGGNTMAWQVRYAAYSGVPDRILICYKDKDPSPVQDPDAGTPLATTTWRTPPVSEPESRLTGESYGGMTPPPTGAVRFPWVVQDSGSWVYAGTGLRDGDLIPALIGDEFDQIVPSYPEPRGVQVLAASPLTTAQGNATYQNATLYTAASGARVFNAGEIDWSFGLDGYNPFYLNGSRADHLGVTIPAVQIMTQNILANFAVRGSASESYRAEKR